MEEPRNWEKEVQSYAEDLFSDLVTRHPMLQHLPPFDRDRENTSHFSKTVGKGVMYLWHTLRKYLEPKLRSDFPNFATSNEMFESYLVSLCDMVHENAKGKHSDENGFSDVHGKVLVFSAILLELVSFLYRRRVTRFLLSAPYYWHSMFKKVPYEKFHRQGGWAGLKLLATKNSEDYDNAVEEIHYDFLAFVPEKLHEAKSDETGQDSENKIKQPTTEAEKLFVPEKLHEAKSDKTGKDSENKKKPTTEAENPSQGKTFATPATLPSKKSATSDPKLSEKSKLTASGSKTGPQSGKYVAPSKDTPKSSKRSSLPSSMGTSSRSTSKSAGKVDSANPSHRSTPKSAVKVDVSNPSSRSTPKSAGKVDSANPSSRSTSKPTGKVDSANPSSRPTSKPTGKGDSANPSNRSTSKPTGKGDSANPSRRSTSKPTGKSDSAGPSSSVSKKNDLKDESELQSSVNIGRGTQRGKKDSKIVKDQHGR